MESSVENKENLNADLESIVRKIFDESKDKDALSFKEVKKIISDQLKRKLSKEETITGKEMLVQLYVEFKKQKEDAEKKKSQNRKKSPFLG